MLGGVYLYTRLDDEIRRHAEQLLAEQYPEFNVQVGAARMIEGRGVLLRDVAIANATEAAADAPSVSVDEIFFAANVTVADLVQGGFRIDHVDIRRPRCRVVRRSDGSWNVAALLPKQPLGNAPIDVRVHNGRLEIACNPSAHKGILLRDINLNLKRESSTNPKHKHSAAEGELEKIQLDAEFGAQLVEQVRLNGEFDAQSGAMQARGSVKNLSLGTALYDQIPADLIGDRSRLSRINGVVDFEFQVSKRASEVDGIRFVIRDGVLNGGAISHPRLSRLATGLSGRWSCDNAGLEIQELTGRFGEATFTAACKRNGWSDDAPIGFGARVSNLTVNQQFIERLAPPMDELWRKFQPQGIVDVPRMRLTFDGQDWRAEEVEIVCKDVAIVPEKFPYRVTAARGGIKSTFRDDLQALECHVDLVCLAGGREARVQSNTIHVGTAWRGWLQVDGEELPIDESLIDAISNENNARDIIQSLHPVGRFDVSWRMEKSIDEEVEPDVQMELQFRNCAVVYDKFIYPVRNIDGRARLANRQWTFSELRGAHGNGIVRCVGGVRPALDGMATDLIFECENVALVDDLRSAMPPPIQRLWSDLRPSGEIDARVSLRHRQGDAKPTIEVAAAPRGETVSIFPMFFPYRFNKLQGEFHLTDGHLELKDLRAQNGRKRMRAVGAVDFNESGDWKVTLEKVAVDRLLADDYDLVAALPPKLRKLVNALRPEGSVSLNDSQFTFVGNTRRGDGIDVAWRLGMGLHGASVESGVKIEDIHGLIRLAGRSNDAYFSTEGELNLDSIMYRGLQFTRVQGPFWANETDVYFGRWAGQETGTPQKDVTAASYGGTLSGGARVHHAHTPAFVLDVTISDGDLARLSTEYLPGQLDVSGRIFGRLNLSGAGKNADAIARSLNGSGQINLTQAKMYELPQIVSLLQVLRVREPDNTAFTKSEMSFRVEGEHLYFDQLDLRGDTISLFGKGELGFNRRLDLTFQYTPGPGDMRFPVVGWVVREVSAQAMELHVYGPLESLKMVSEPLPGLNDALQQLSSELEPVRRAGVSPTRGARSVFGPPARR